MPVTIGSAQRVIGSNPLGNSATGTPIISSPIAAEITNHTTTGAHRTVASLACSWPSVINAAYSRYTATGKKYNITDTRAAAFPIPTKGQAIYWDEKQSGLGLRVTANGARSWIVQGYVNGKSRRFTLGLLDELDYKEAREEASSTRASMRKGVNPLEEKKKRQNKPSCSFWIAASFLFWRREKARRLSEKARGRTYAQQLMP